MSTRIALHGGGMMGGAILAGILRGSSSPDEISVVEASSERADLLRQRYGVAVVGPDALADVAAAAIHVVAVKPHHAPGVLRALAPHLSDGALVVSVVAGLTTDTLERDLPAGTPVVRVMPNTPALVGAGAAATSRGAHATAEHAATVADLLAGTGLVVEVPEAQQNAVTALSGSGPAYVFAVVEALVDGGVLLGLPRPTATRLAVQTLRGAAAMLEETGEHPTILREQVTSPGGTTAAALRELEEYGLKAAFLTAMRANADRSEEIAAANED